MNTEQLQIIERLTKQGMNSPEYLLTTIIKESYISKQIFEMKSQLEQLEKFNEIKKYSEILDIFSCKQWRFGVKQINDEYYEAIHILEYILMPKIISYIKDYDIELNEKSDLIIMTTNSLYIPHLDMQERMIFIYNKFNSNEIQKYWDIIVDIHYKMDL